MNFIKNLKIKIKLGVSILILSLTAIITSIVGIATLYSVDQESQKIIDTGTTMISSINGLSTGIQNLEKLLFAYYLNPNIRAQVMNNINTQLETCQKHIDTYSQLPLLPEEINYFSQFSTDYNAYVNELHQMINLCDQNQDDTALKMLNSSLGKDGYALEGIVENILSYQEQNIKVAAQIQQTTYKEGFITLVCLAVFCVIIALIIFLFCGAFIARPIQKAQEELAAIMATIHANKGDLSMRLTQSSHDDIGQLVEGINLFISTLEKLMGHMVHHSGQLDLATQNILQQVTSSTNSATHISCMMQDMSASMEELSASVSSVTDGVNYIQTDINEISTDADSIQQYSMTMKTRADELKTNAMTNHQQTKQMLIQIEDALKSAMKDSENVEEISNLTSQILSVSKQTNLLALNASIEAARAGDAGKGFSVVADEIRELADSSKQTATHIQDMNHLILSSVHALIDHANTMIQYHDPIHR